MLNKQERQVLRVLFPLGVTEEQDIRIKKIKATISIDDMDEEEYNTFIDMLKVAKVKINKIHKGGIKNE